MPKRLLSLLLSVVLAAGSCMMSSVPAAAVPVTYEVSVRLNELQIPTDASTKPYMNHNGRTMISVRSVMEALRPIGCSVRWNEALRAVHLDCLDKEIDFFFVSDQPGLGLPAAVVNGRMHLLYTAPEINRDRAFLGLRDLGDLLEADVDFLTLDNGDTWVATINTDRADVAEMARRVEAVAEYMVPYTFTKLDGDRMTYEVVLPSYHAFPVEIRPHLIGMYLRTIQESNDMMRLYNTYAYADPPDDGMRLVSTPIGIAAASADQRAQRQLAFQQIRRSEGGKILASRTPGALRTYYTNDGIRVETFPTGEKHYLNKAQALDLASKFKLHFWAGMGLTGLGTWGLLAKAWPVGTAAAGLVAFAHAGHNLWLETRVKDYCLPASKVNGEERGVIMKYYYVRLPGAVAGPVDAWAQASFDFDPNVGRILKVLPTDCLPWT